MRKLSSGKQSSFLVSAFLTLSALEEHVGEADGVGLRENLLAVEVDVRLGREFGELRLGCREHATRPAGDVGHLDDLAGLEEVLRPLCEGELGHEADHLTRRVVVTGLGVLREAPDDLLEHVAHCVVVDARRVEIEIRELANDAREA